MSIHTRLSVLFILAASVSVNAHTHAPSQHERIATTETIPGDNVLRFYRMAIPVTYTAYEEDFGHDYEKALLFWTETEAYLNRIYVPLGFCFDVIKDKKLVMTEHNMIDENVFNAPAYGTELLNQISALQPTT